MTASLSTLTSFWVGFARVIGGVMTLAYTFAPFAEVQLPLWVLGCGMIAMTGREGAELVVMVLTRSAGQSSPAEPSPPPESSSSSSDSSRG